MVRGRQRAEWDHTASLMSLLANINRDSRKCRRPFKPQDFHPIKSDRPAISKEANKANFALLKAAFVPKEKR